MMNSKLIFGLLLAVMFSLVSCHTNQDVITSHLFQKRKYLKGYYLAGNKKIKDKRHKENLVEQELGVTTFGSERSLKSIEAGIVKEQIQASIPGNKTIRNTIGFEERKIIEETTLSKANYSDSFQLFKKLRYNIRHFIDKPSGSMVSASEPTTNVGSIFACFFGFLGFLTSWFIPIVPFFLGLVALIIGLVTLGDARDTDRILAIIGITFGAAAMLISGLLIFFFLAWVF